MSGWTRIDPPLSEIQLTTLNAPLLTFTMPESRREHDVHAPYQRGSVWNDTQRRDLIRSLLLSVPVGAVIRAKRLRASGDEPYFRIVDGKQRLEALWAFIDDELGVPADWFADRCLQAELISRDGIVRYSGLSEYGRRMIDNHTIAVIELTSDIETIEVAAGTGTHGSARQYTHRRRSEREALAYEAFVYGLINSSGTAQTAADLAHAQAVADD